MVTQKEPRSLDVRTLRTARMLVERHGAGALAFARAQAERLAKQGSAASAAEWERVIAAIRHLTSGGRQR